MLDYSKIDIPDLAKGTVISPEMQFKMMEEEKRKKNELRNYRLGIIGAVCGVIGTLTGVASLIVSIVK